MSARADRKPPGSAALSPAAAAAVARARVLLQAWQLALPDEPAPGLAVAPCWQLGLRFVHERVLAGQPDGAGSDAAELDLMFAKGLVSLAEAALWQAADADTVPWACLQAVRATVAQAEALLAKAGQAAGGAA